VALYFPSAGRDQFMISKHYRATAAEEIRFKYLGTS